MPLKETPVNIDDFKPLAKLVAGYELDPSKAYLIVCDGKDFSAGLAHALMNDIRQMHPDVNIAIVATLKPKSIEVREKKDGPTEPVSGNSEAGPGAPAGSPDSESGR
jgi:hypothetical protein